MSKAAASKAGSDDEDAHDEASFEDIGKSFTFTSKLTASEAAALESSKPPARNQEDQDELHPLPAAQRNVTYVDVVKPYKSHPLAAGAEALCVAASSTGNTIAVGGRHGKVQLLNPQSLEPMDTLDLGDLGPAASGPCAAAPQVVTALRFRPDLASSGMQNVLLVAQGDAVVHVHVGTRKVLATLHEAGNKINALDVQAGGKLFATAGTDCAVRVYDEATGAKTHTLDHGDGVTAAGHSNHVFSVVFKEDDPQVLLSGGWDQTVQVWDLRVHRSVRHISGPYVCGDAVDVQGSQVLTGSWRHANALQLWDFGSGRLHTNLPWWQPEPDACLVYAAKFGRGALAGTVVAGGSGHKPMVRWYTLGGGPASAALRGTMLLARPVHALAAVPGAAQGAAEAAQPGVVVCCDREVHLMHLKH